MIAKRIYNKIFFSKYYSYKNYTILCPKTWHRFIVKKEAEHNETESVQQLGRETLEELNDTVYLDETENQEQRDIENMQNRETQEK